LKQTTRSLQLQTPCRLSIKLPRCLVCGGVKVEWGGHWVGTMTCKTCYAVRWNVGAFDERANTTPDDPVTVDVLFYVSCRHIVSPPITSGTHTDGVR